MDNILHFDLEENDNYISTLAFLLPLNKNSLLPSELETCIKCMYHCIAVNTNNFYHQWLIALDKESSIIVNSYRLSSHDPWLSKLIILASLKHCPAVEWSRKSNCSLVASLDQAMVTFKPDCKESIHLLRLITVVIKYLNIDLRKQLAVPIFKFTQLAACSPLKGFKQYVAEIAKFVISFKELEKVTHLSYLPIRGLSTSNLKLQFEPGGLKNVVLKILEMFENNIENREAGLLYKVVLNELQGDFNKWAREVWPYFLIACMGIHSEGEFFQSLLKYWIPHTLQAFEHRAYEFLYEEKIPSFVKGYVLLEARKRFFVTHYTSKDWHLIQDLSSQNKNTFALALQIIARPLKSSVPISKRELQFVREYLEEEEDVLYDSQAKALQDFINQAVKSTTEECSDFINKLLSYSSSLLKNNRRDLGAQILTFIYLAKEAQQGSQEDCFNAISIEQALVETHESDNANLSHLAALVVHSPTILDNTFLLKIINHSSASSVQVGDSVRNMTVCVASINAKHNEEPNSALLSQLYEQLQLIFNNTALTIDEMFKAALVIDSLSQVSKVIGKNVEIHKAYSTWICLVGFPKVANILIGYSQPEKEDGILKGKNKKIVEALYNNMCLFIIENKSVLHAANYFLVADTIIQVIEQSSMRRPTMVSADLLKHLVIAMDEIVLQSRASSDAESRELLQKMINFKTSLLFKTLSKVKQTTALQTLSIRRNPETRLVIHALCSSDSSSQKTILNSSLKHLFETLDDGSNSDAVKAAAMHCLEVLMSDNSLYNWTLTYAQDAILACIRHFGNRNWTVRNACIQLEKALVDRFLGVCIGPDKRFKSHQDLFQLFPHLVLHFYQALTQSNLNDCALGVMQFFTESQIKPQPFPSDLCLVTKKAFLHVLFKLILNSSDLYGSFAARAFVSLVLPTEIKPVIQYVVNFVIENIIVIRGARTLGNFVLLLKELSRNDNSHDFRKFRKFLKKYGELEQCDLLLVKVFSTDDCLAALRSQDLDLAGNYKRRVWINNYLPVILSESKALPAVTQLLSRTYLPECVRIKVLSLVISNIDKASGGETLFYLLDSLFTFEPTSNYLWMCYFRASSFFFETFSSLSKVGLLASKVRESFQQGKAFTNLHKTCIFHLILSAAPCGNKNEKFIKSTLKFFNDLSEYDEDVVEDVSRTLFYVYRNSNKCFCVRKDLLTIAVRFLIEHREWHFIESITNIQISNPIRALRIVLSYRFLVDFLGSDDEGLKLVRDLYTAVWKRQCAKTQFKCNDTFYEAEQEGCVDIDTLGRVVIGFLKEYCSLRQLDSWFTLCSQLCCK